MLVKSVPNRMGADGDFSIIGSNGQRIWEGTIDASRNTSVTLATNGRYFCLGYRKLIGENRRTLCEKHVALYTDSGRELWDKGSMFFQIEAIAVTVGGCVVVANGRRLFTLDSDRQAGALAHAACSCVQLYYIPRWLASAFALHRW